MPEGEQEQVCTVEYLAWKRQDEEVGYLARSRQAMAPALIQGAAIQPANVSPGGIFQQRQEG